MARGFGATVTLDAPTQGLYLVIGYHMPPVDAVRGVQGHVVLVLPQRRTVLAMLATEAHPQLLRHGDVMLAGPVTIDPERFARFTELAGLDD